MARKAKEDINNQEGTITDSIEEEYDPFVDLEVIILTGGKLPEYKSDWAAGMDVYARLYDIEKTNALVQRGYEHPDITNDDTVIIAPNQQSIIDAGIQVNIPEGFEIQVRPRSGLSAKNEITITNSPGTIDVGYLDNIMIILKNLGQKPLVVKHGDRIAQIVLQQVPRIKWVEVDNFGDSYNRGGGLGSTGV